MVVQYRGDILPIVPLAVQLGSGGNSSSLHDPASVIVFADGERRIGLLVEKFLDIVEEAVKGKKSTTRPGLLGSAVIGGKVTDFLDLQTVIHGVETGWFEGQSDTRNRSKTILLAEPSPFSRSLIRNCLEMAGHRVLEASGPQETLGLLEKQPADLVLAALELPDRGAFSFVQSLQRQPEFRHLPVVALSGQAESHARGVSSGDGLFADCLFKFDREAMLRSIQRRGEALQHTYLPSSAPEKELIHG